MKNINVGITNHLLSEKYSNIFLNEGSDDFTEQKNEVIKYLNIIKSSPILLLEYNVYNRLLNKKISDKELAIRYIDNNIKLFDVYTSDEIISEHKKIKQFIPETTKTDNFIVENAIYSLIVESVSENEKINVDKLHESFNTLLEHITKKEDKQKSNIELDIDADQINEHVIKIAIDKFNQKYSSLNENEINIIKTIVNADLSEKNKMFENYKTEVLEIINTKYLFEYSEQTNKVVEKINSMTNDTLDENIILLYELLNDIR